MKKEYFFIEETILKQFISINYNISKRDIKETLLQLLGHIRNAKAVVLYIFQSIIIINPDINSTFWISYPVIIRATF